MAVHIETICDRSGCHQRAGGDQGGLGWLKVGRAGRSWLYFCTELCLARHLIESMCCYGPTTISELNAITVATQQAKDRTKALRETFAETVAQNPPPPSEDIGGITRQGI
jgi:hypothetical protein